MELSVSALTRSRAARRLAAGVLACAAVGAATAAPAAAKNPTPTVVTTTRAGGQAVALTFDDGPNGADTARLLDVLAAQHVKATFCLWGDHVRRHPELVRRIVAEGHTLCNHTMHHDDLSAAAPAAIRADLESTSALIRSIVPGEPVPYFRAPYGAWGADGRVARVAADLGMQPLGWAFDVEDWVPPGADVLAQRVRERLTPGAVVLMHDGGGDRSQTVDAVEVLVPELKAAGWRFSLPAVRG